MEFITISDGKTIGLFIERVNGVLCLTGIDDNEKQCPLMAFSNGGFNRFERVDLNGIETDERGRIKDMNFMK